MKTKTEIVNEAAERRGARIIAMQRGQKIPYPESAEQDARPGNEDDQAVIAVLRGQRSIAGDGLFPPSELLKNPAARVVHGSGNFGNERTAANEQVIEAIGPTVTNLT